MKITARSLYSITKIGCPTLALVLLAASHTSHADIVYVMQTASGANDGSSWDEAYTHLQSGIDNANPGDQVWVAAGTYHPNDIDPSNLDRTQSFALKNGVEVYGGFAGNESVLEDRDPVAHPVVLSGDLNGDDADTDDDGRMDASTGDNAYHVFYHPSPLALDASAVLDSVTIGGGRADSPSPHNQGGAIYNDSSSPMVSNCTLKDNSASHEGGAVYNDSCSAVLNNCLLTYNSAPWGGAVSNDYGSPTLSNCTLNANSASSGGGAVANNSSSPVLSNCTLSRNTAPGNGGAIFNTNSSSPILSDCTLSGNMTFDPGGAGGAMHNSSSSSSLTNCTLSGNSASDDGGAIYSRNESPLALTNCTLSGNSSAGAGGGVYCYDDSPLTLTNCVIWGNQGNGGQIIGVRYSPIEASHCIIEDGFTGGTAIIDADPLLLPLGDYGGSIETTPIAHGSPAIDQALASEAPETDQRGFARDAAPDIGACEQTPDSGHIHLTSVEGTLHYAVGFSPSLILWSEMQGLSAQWHYGVSGDTSQPVPGGAGTTVTLPSLTGNVSVWARLETPQGIFDSPALAIATSPSPFHVSMLGSDTNDGSSWGRAKRTLEAALVEATGYGAQVWMSKGTYVPSGWPNGGTEEREKHFSLKRSVAVYGGFSGDESALEERDPAAHPVVLSGDLNGDDADTDGDGLMDKNTAENAYHVLYHPYSLTLDTSAVLDSVTIRGGRADGLDSVSYYGGAIYNSSCSPTLRNCTLTDNAASYNGGGIYNIQCSPVLVNCTLSGNSANYGGGIYNSWSSPTLTNCTLTCNSASVDGGAIHNESSYSVPALSNCTVSGNSAANRGGAIYSQTSTGRPTLANCIFWDNQGSGGRDGQVYGAAATTSHCIIEGGFTGATAIIDADPLLLPLGDYGGPTPTMPVSHGSPAIDAGLAAVAPQKDQRGFARDTSPDIGACEFIRAAIVHTGISLPGAIGSLHSITAYSELPSPSFQWYYGQSGDTSMPVPGGTTVNLQTGPLEYGISLWVREAAGGPGSDSPTFDIEIRGNYSEWCDYHSLTGEERDPDTCLAPDGICNLLKFAMGLQPRIPSPPDRRPQLSYDSAAETLNHQWRFSKTPADLVRSFWRSVDLLDWHSSGVTQALVDQDAGFEDWNISIPTSEEPGGFLRLNVERTGN